MTDMVVDGYQIHEEIGRGGTGVVYHAVELDTERDVAIKVIEHGQTNNPEFIRRFHVEAQFISKLEHPHIVPLYNYRREPGRVCLIMRYLRGHSLRDWLARHGPLDTVLVAQMLDQIASALGYAHRRNIVHRDIKPGNILLDEDGNFYLADFGFTVTIKGVEIGGIGTPEYAAPELWRGQPATPQSDIYGLGLTVYETLTGQKPVHAANPGEAISDEYEPGLTQAASGLPAAVDVVIRRAADADDTARYADAAQMAQDFRMALEHHRAAPVTAPVLDNPTNPYKGLHAFQEADAADFFGRESLTAQLVSRMSGTGQQPGDTDRFLALVGASGSGKSSVIRAGMFPALRHGVLPEAKNWLLTSMTPGSHPFEALESALRDVAVQSTTGLAGQMRQDPCGLLRAVEQVLPGDGSEILLFIDQFEEMFTLVEDESERIHFLGNLTTAVRDSHSRFRLVIALRADYYDRPLKYPGFADLMRRCTEVVVPLTPEEIREAMVRPAQRANLVLDEALIETIITTLGSQPGSLPFLQYTLTELYNQRDSNHLTLELYHATGGLSGALAQRAEAIYGELDPNQREVARQIFLRLVVFGDGVETTRQRVKRAELTALILQPGKDRIRFVLDEFSRHRLLTLDYDLVTRSPTVEIAHEILIQAWGRLRDWLNASREYWYVQWQLINAAREWANAGRDPGFLASGTRLAHFEALAAESDLAINEEERIFLAASIAERRRQDAEREAERKRTLTLQRGIIGLLAVSLLAVTILSIFALSSRRDALSEADVAFARQLAAQAVTELQKPVGNDEFAALLAVRSLNIRYDPIADQALVEAASRLPRQVFTGHTDEIYAVAFSPDGHSVVTGSADHTAKVWDVATGKIRYTLAGHNLDIWAVAFSPDGKYILTGSADHTAKLWDVATGSQVRTLTGHTEVVTSVAFSPDGRYLATGSGDSSIKLWEIATGHDIRTFTGHTSAVKSLAFSADGATLLSGSGDYLAKLWDVSTGQDIRTFRGHDAGIYGVAFSPDGKYVLTAGLDNTARLWDTATGQEVRTLRGHSNSVRTVAFSPDGRYALTGSGDHTARLWDVATGQEVRSFRGHDAGIYGVAFSPDGRSMVTGSSDGTAKLWDVDADPTAHILRTPGYEVYRVAFSPDGTYALTGSADKTAKLWDIATGRPVRAFGGNDDDVYAVAFSPDGKYALTGSADKTAKLWEVATGQAVRTLSGHTDAIYGVAFSPDGKYILTGSGDSTAKLWEVATGQEVRTLSGHTATVESVAFSPDGASIITASEDKTAKLWDTATGQEVRTFRGYRDTVYSAVFSPDGGYILTGSADKTAKLWEVATGQEVRTFSGHSHTIYGVAFSPDGRYVLTASADRTARVWDTATGQTVRTLSGHTDALWSAVFSPDGKFVLTGSFDYTARLWDTDYHDLLRGTCARLLRDFTDQERQNIPIVDHDPTCPSG